MDLLLAPFGEMRGVLVVQLLSTIGWKPLDGKQALTGVPAFNLNDMIYIPYLIKDALNSLNFITHGLTKVPFFN